MFEYFIVCVCLRVWVYVCAHVHSREHWFCCVALLPLLSQCAVLNWHIDQSGQSQCFCTTASIADILQLRLTNAVNIHTVNLKIRWVYRPLCFTNYEFKFLH